jgi:hypothetical protein
MSSPSQSLVDARDAATNLVRGVLEALERGGEPSRAIDLGRAPIGPLASSGVGCPISRRACDPDSPAESTAVSLENLVNALDRARELLLLVDRGLEGPGIPPDVVEQIGLITGHRR